VSYSQVSLWAGGALLKAAPFLLTRGTRVEEAESKDGQSQHHIEIAVIAIPGQRMHKEFAHGLKVRRTLTRLVGNLWTEVLLVKGAAFHLKSPVK